MFFQETPTWILLIGGTILLVNLIVFLLRIGGCIG